MFSGADTDHVKVVIWSNCLIYTKSENMVSKSGKIGEIIKKKLEQTFTKSVLTVNPPILYFTSNLIYRLFPPSFLHLHCWLLRWSQNYVSYLMNSFLPHYY